MQIVHTRRVDTESLRTFLAVHRSGGFTSASRSLHRSQPAISRRVALLEHEIGARLFERAAGGVALSQAGHALLPHAERALAALEDCAAAVRALRERDAGPLAIAAVGTLASTELTALLARFRTRHPAVALTLRTASSEEVSQLVRRGEATLGLRYHRDPSSDVSCVELRPERLVVCCARSHPSANGRVPALAKLAGEPWLAFANAHEATTGSLVTHFLARGIASIRWTPIDSLTAQKRLVEAGFGLALLPESSVREELAAGSLATIAVADLRAQNPVFAVVRKGAYLSRSAGDLLEQLAASGRGRRARSARS